MKEKSVSVILLAGGKGKRMGVIFYCSLDDDSRILSSLYHLILLGSKVMAKF